MKILLFGGTTEGRELARALTAMGCEVTVCVATEMGAEELLCVPGLDVRAGRMPREEITALLPAYDLCVDATHPYAERISASVRWACGRAGVPLRRILRPAQDPGGCITVPDQRAAAVYLQRTEGNIMLTTGAKELSAYEQLDKQRLFVRILPTQEGIAICEALGLPHRNIIAMQGPFSEELNEALFRQFRIRWVVTKDGGVFGGFQEKRRAARSVGAAVILISRPEESEGITAEALLAQIKEETA